MAANIYENFIDSVVGKHCVFINVYKPVLQGRYVATGLWATKWILKEFIWGQHL